MSDHRPPDSIDPLDEDDTRVDRIRQVHWDIVPRDVVVPRMEACSVVLAIWPAPVNADACFASAGFRVFADADDGWESDWRGIVSRALARLEQFGSPAARVEAEICQVTSLSRFCSILCWLLPQRLFLKPVQLPIAEQILVVTTDDRVGEVFIEYGIPTEARLLASSGHELLWIGWATSEYVPERFVKEIAAGLPVVRTTLKWQALVPILRSTNPI
jgi:hypothetical protein